MESPVGEDAEHSGEERPLPADAKGAKGGEARSGREGGQELACVDVSGVYRELFEEREGGEGSQRMSGHGPASV